MQTRLYHLAALLMLAALLFSTNIGGYDLWPADEPRYAEVAREMMESGDYLAPHVNGAPYREKPPLLFWAIAAASWPFGEVTEVSARIPSVAAALVVLVCTHILAERMYGPQTAWWACLMLMTGTRFWWQARTAQIDMLLTACLSVALCAFYAWTKSPRASTLILFYAAVAAAVYAKGPPGVLFPIFLVIIYFWRRPADRRKMHPLWGLAAVCVLVAAWLIPARMAVAHETGNQAEQAIASNLFHQTIGRFFLGVSKVQWPWYYLINLPVDWLPWALFLPWTVPWVWARRREDDRVRLLLAWVVPAFIFFSICIGKRAIYLLPIYPALAILVARSALALVESPRIVWRRRTAYAWIGLLLAIAAAVGVAVRSSSVGARGPELLPLAFAAGLLALHGVYVAARTDMRKLHWMLAAHFIVLATVGSLYALPVVNEFKSARSFCAPIRALSGRGEAFRLYSVLFSREEYIFYSRHFHEAMFVDTFPIELPAHLDPQRIKEQKELLQEAVGEVPIEKFSAVTDEEVERLQAALHEATEQEGEDALDTSMRGLLLEAAEAFADLFMHDGAAFVFVQEKDWRWLVAVHPSLRASRLVHAHAVGRRDVMLIAESRGCAPSYRGRDP